MKKTYTLFLFAILLITTVINAQPAIRLYDCNPGSDGSNLWGPSVTVCMGDKYYFVSRTNSAGAELWVSSGTTATTYMVKNIGPGPNDGGIDKLTPVGNVLYFFADDGNGRELWRTDGTEANTFMVKDAAINGTFQGSTPALQFVEYNGKLVYVFNNGTNGPELWSSDGTSAGTNMIINLQTAPTFFDPNQEAGAGIFRLALFDGYIYFHGNKDSMRSLWKTDGTAAGTTKIKDFMYDPNVQYVDSLKTMGNKMYFFGSDGTTGAELWVSDGTTAGTQLIKDIKAGPGSSYPNQFRMFGNYIYFTADSSTNNLINDSQIWKTDGTTAGTTKVTTGPLTVASFWGMHESKLFYSKYDASFTTIPWVLNTANNDEHYILSPDITSPSENSAYRNGYTYFAAKSAANNTELWKTDGTVTGTTMYQDINPVNPGSFGDEGANGPFTFCGNYLYFRGNDNATGMEPWVINIVPVLPLTLLNFSGTYADKKAILNWQTENEINTDKFIVEKSTDARVFTYTGTIQAKNTVQKNYYQFSDNISAPEVTVFYRLKQVDKDGKTTYSNVVKISTVKQRTFTIYPSPARNYISFDGNDIIKQIGIINQAGQIVMQVTNNSQNQYDITRLSKGIYLAAIKTEVGISYQKFQKQ
jgi:ELWxxDGT repeat protein